jgi:hypothetical protein
MKQNCGLLCGRPATTAIARVSLCALCAARVAMIVALAEQATTAPRPRSVA